jgi:hypothetical protein
MANTLRCLPSLALRARVPLRIRQPARHFRAMPVLRAQAENLEDQAAEQKGIVQQRQQPSGAALMSPFDFGGIPSFGRMGQVRTQLPAAAQARHAWRGMLLRKVGQKDPAALAWRVCCFAARGKDCRRSGSPQLHASRRFHIVPDC